MVVGRAALLLRVTVEAPSCAGPEGVLGSRLRIILLLAWLPAQAVGCAPQLPAVWRDTSRMVVAAVFSIWAGVNLLCG